MTQTLERFMHMEIKFVLGKNGDHTSSSFNGRWIVVVRQADKP